MYTLGFSWIRTNFFDVTGVSCGGGWNSDTTRWGTGTAAGVRPLRRGADAVDMFSLTDICGRYLCACSQSLRQPGGTDSTTRSSVVTAGNR